MKKKLLLYFVVVISSCWNWKQPNVIYIKMQKNVKVNEKYKVRIFLRGVRIGEVKEKLSYEQDEYILLRADISEKSNKNTFTKALYKEDLLGNAYIELISEQSRVFSDKKSKADTIFGEFSPLYHEVDSASKKKILKEIGNFKNKIDSILGNVAH